MLRFRDLLRIPQITMPTAERFIAILAIANPRSPSRSAASTGSFSPSILWISTSALQGNFYFYFLMKLVKLDFSHKAPVTESVSEE